MFRFPCPSAAVRIRSIFSTKQLSWSCPRSLARPSTIPIVDPVAIHHVYLHHKVLKGPLRYREAFRSCSPAAYPPQRDCCVQRCPPCLPCRPRRSLHRRLQASRLRPRSTFAELPPCSSRSTDPVCPLLLANGRFWDRKEQETASG